MQLGGEQANLLDAVHDSLAFLGRGVSELGDGLVRQCRQKRGTVTEHLRVQERQDRLQALGGQRPAPSRGWPVYIEEEDA